MATPEWFGKLKHRMAEIVEIENDVLERDMVRSQEVESEKGETEEDMYRRIRLEQEKQEEEEIAKRLHEWNSRNVSKVSRGVYCALCVLICVTMIALLMYTVTTLPSFGSPDHPINNEVSARYIEKGLQETGAVNIVTGMILDYRAFDTLGESTVLFTAAMVVLFLLRLDSGSEKYSQLARSMKEAPHADNFSDDRQNPDADRHPAGHIRRAERTPFSGRRLLRRRHHGRGLDYLRHGVRLCGYPPVLHLQDVSAGRAVCAADIRGEQVLFVLYRCERHPQHHSAGYAGRNSLQRTDPGAEHLRRLHRHLYDVCVLRGVPERRSIRCSVNC